jgi:hypothetical protein
MKNTFLGILALLILGISCKKSSSSSDNTPTQPYMSLTAGSTWDYEITNNLTSITTTNRVTSTTKDTSIGTKKYYVFTNSNGTGNSYYNITGNEHWTFTSLGAGSNGVENIYLKPDKQVGDNWSTTATVPVGNGTTTAQVTFTNTIAAKGVSKTVNAITYTDVIQIKTTIVVQGFPLSQQDIIDIQSYYAPKVGLIESKYKIISVSLPGINIDQNTLLKTSTIN